MSIQREKGRGPELNGIIALIDEATGFQKDRAADALAKILEAFVATGIREDIPRRLLRGIVSASRPEVSGKTRGKLSNDYSDFITKLNRLHPRFGETVPLALEEGDR